MPRLGNYDALWLLFAVVLVLGPAYAWNFWRKAKALRGLAAAHLLARINVSVSRRRQAVKAAMLVIAFVLTVIALSRPISNPRPKEVRRKGRDVAILLDVSRSMLAEDIRPNRLERAKIAIGDMMTQLAGDRIAIVTFAGDSTVRCPLTTDYAFVRMVLDSIGTESTPLGGTRIGDAIRDATKKVFDEESRDFRDVILITDGEDHDSFPVEAAEVAGGVGIRIIAIGLGDDGTGAPIPVVGTDGRRTYLEYDGEQVRSRLDAATLHRVALATPGGRFVQVTPQTTFNLDEIYDWLVASAQKHELESGTVVQYDEHFQLFLAAAVVLIFLEALVSERKKV
ncbi:MAG: VWA domain-containing protein [Phycisphaerae bacterium]|nr:VWA domain-containing protein [Phycisphaerae bacterium]